MIVYRDLPTLEKELGFSACTLYAISNNLQNHYKRVNIPKRDGSSRTLSVPDDILKRVQRAIADKILAYEDVSVFATAYKTAGGVSKNARPHVGKRKLLKLDIYRFFDSILYSRVKEKVFPKNRFSEPIRVLLTMLCYFGEVLPQGAPTSPVITNILMRDFDVTVGAWCRQRSISYTRYCDDMTFSGDFDEAEVVSFVTERLRENGFILNRKKTALVPSTKRQTVTGIVVNQKINVSSDYKRKIRSEFFYCTKYGVQSHLKRIGSTQDAAGYLHGLLGRISFVLQVCPHDKAFEEYKGVLVKMIKELDK